jgi:hypothetical protein
MKKSTYIAPNGVKTQKGVSTLRLSINYDHPDCPAVSPERTEEIVKAWAKRLLEEEENQKP